MIPLAVPNLSGNERKYLNECIDTTFVSSVGEFVKRFEEMTAKAAGVAYGASASAGTTALQMALQAVGVKPGDLVIIPSFTFIATANAVSHCHAQVWCMDIDAASFTLNPEQLEHELEKETEVLQGNCIHKKTGKRVAAVMPVYTLGNPADMDRINAIAKRYGLAVVADAACAIGAGYKGKPIGGLADVTAFSFNGNKTLTAGGGGMAVSNEKEKIDWIHHVSSTARVSRDYDHDQVGYNYRITNLQAAVGCAQLEQLERFVQRKKEIRAFYNKSFEGIKGLEKFPEPEWADSSCWFSGFILDKEVYPSVREICDRLAEQGVEARTFWKPVHLQKPYGECLCSDMTVTEQLWDRIITLPCSTGITDEELSKVRMALMYVLK